MPGTNSFYPYGESSTNILNNSEYQTDSERSSGAQSGAIARSKLYNKQARQAAAGAYAVGALVAKSGKNADDSSAATLAANFQGAVSYQAAHFVASDVSVSGTTATATVAELATTAAADLPALFALSLVLDQALPAGASIAIASSLPDVTLSWPIYVGSEALDSDTITGGAITLLIDTVGAKAFFKAGGGRYKPTDLPPLNPNFTMEISKGDSEDTVTVTADMLTISPTTDMLAGGQWEYGTEMSPAPGKGQNIKYWTREQLVVPEDPSLSAQTVSTLAEEQSGTAVQLNQIPQGSVLKIKENGQDVDFYVAKHDYESGLNGAGRTLVVRKDTYDDRAWDNGNVNAYASSDLDSWFNSTYKNMLDADIRSLIGTTKIRYTPGNGNNTVGTLERAIFALSLTELGRSHTYANTEGSALPIASTLRIAYRNGSPTTQWTRSPHTNNTGSAWRLHSGGDAISNVCYYSNGSRPAFTLPGDSYATANDDGTYTFTGTEPPDTGPTVSFSFTVPHGTQPVVRQYTYNYEEHYQTMLEGGVLPALGGDTGPTYSEVLSENTWAQIAQAVADKDPILDVWQVGDTKDEVIAGETLTFAIMGKNMDDLADGSGKAGLTFGMTQLMASTRQMNSSSTNVGSFAGSAMYSWLSGTIYPNLPSELKDAIKAVNKKTSSGGSSSVIRTDAMYLWLFSKIEVFGTTTHSYAGEGTQYPYFATAAERIKRLSNGAGAASYWWERSPCTYTSGSFCYISPSGTANYNYANSSCAVCFGFCI